MYISALSFDGSVGLRYSGDFLTCCCSSRIQVLLGIRYRFCLFVSVISVCVSVSHVCECGLCVFWLIFDVFSIVVDEYDVHLSLHIRNRFSQ